MRPLLTPADFDALADAPVALVYKHSDRCPISALAREQVEQLEAQRPETPVWVIEVNAQPALSRHVADRLHIRHQSPQAIVLVHGDPVWDASHFQVRTPELVREVDAAMAESA